MSTPEMEFTIRDQALSHLYLYVVISISSTYLLGALFYADKFNFWQHALSELGTTKTLTGTPNTISAYLVALGIFITGWLLLTVLYKRSRLKMSTFEHILTRQSA